MTERKIFCHVEGCHRGSYESTLLKRYGTTNVSIICGHHWRRLTKREKAVWRRIKRIAARYGWEAVGERGDRIWTALRRRAGE